MLLTLDTEEPGKRHEQETDDTPNPEEVAADVVEADWCHHNHHELPTISEFVSCVMDFKYSHSRANG
jgi:hypothetical protein